MNPETLVYLTGCVAASLVVCLVLLRRSLKKVKSLNEINRTAVSVNQINAETYMREVENLRDEIRQLKQMNSAVAQRLEYLKEERDELVAAVNQAFANTRWNLVEQEE